jgi:tetratricopeptide (TPR) repeat protein
MTWLQFPLRHPRSGLLVVLLIALAGYFAWFGISALLVRRDRAQAEQALADYNFAEARRRIDHCIKLRPSDPELRLLAARTARRDGDLAAAEEHLRIRRGLVGGSSPEEILESALQTAQRGQLHEVTPFLIDLLDVHHPQSEFILEALAAGNAEIYDLERAVFWTQELLARWPKNGLGLLLRAQTTYTQGQRDKAIMQLQTLVTDYPKFSKARSFLAGILFKSQRYTDAGVHYSALLQQEPGEIFAKLGLASCYSRLGDIEHARPLLEQLEREGSNQSEVLLECGRFAILDKRPDDAQRLLVHALELQPYDHDIHRELGVCLAQLGKLDEANQHIERSKQIEADLILLEKAVDTMSKSPNDPKPRREAGEICLRNGQISEGLRWLHGALEIAPNDRLTQKILANYNAGQGNPERTVVPGSKGP